MLYVVDSVTRLWIEQARKPGQPTGPDAVDGTFAAGVNHVTDLMPSIMTDIINTAPQDQKVRIYEEPILRPMHAMIRIIFLFLVCKILFVALS